MSVIVNQQHYVKDKCLGGSLRIDGKNAYVEFNADLYDIDYGAGSIEQSYERKVGKSSFDAYHFDFETQQLTLSLYVGGIDKNDAFFNVNKLIAACKDCVIQHEDDSDYEFASVLTDYSVEFTDIEWFYSVELTFDAIRRMPLTEAKVSSAKELEFVNFGSVVSGAKITLTSSWQAQNVSITCKDRFGNSQVIKIDNLRANVPFIIDGINGEVLENEINVFSHTDMVMFPMVMPGSNKISSSSTLSIKVEFYPTFEI